MRVTIHQTLTFEVYGKTITGLGPKELVKWLLWGMLQLLREYFGQKLCIFHTIFSIIRVHMKLKCLTFFQKLSICMEKHSEKGRGVLVTALPGLERKTYTAMGRRK